MVCRALSASELETLLLWMTDSKCWLLTMFSSRTLWNVTRCRCVCRQLLHCCVQAVIDSGIKLSSVLADSFKQCLQSFNDDSLSVTLSDRLVTLGFSLGNEFSLILLTNRRAYVISSVPFASFPSPGQSFLFPPLISFEQSPQSRSLLSPFLPIHLHLVFHHQSCHAVPPHDAQPNAAPTLPSAWLMTHLSTVQESSPPGVTMISLIRRASPAWWQYQTACQDWVKTGSSDRQPV